MSVSSQFLTWRAPEVVEPTTDDQVKLR